MARERIGPLRGALVGATMLLLLSSCGGATVAKTPAQDVRAAIATATPAATIPSGSAPTQAGGSSELLAKGKLIFEKTAGGVGCAYCHGLDGKGTGPAGLKAANIQGKTEDLVRYAMRELPMMAIVKLTDDEVTAVVAYLQTLVDK